LTSHDLLFGHQVVYLLGFGLNNCIEEMWIKLDWSIDDGRKQLTPIAFAAAAMTISTRTMIGFNALRTYFHCTQVILEETFAFINCVVECHDSPFLSWYTSAIVSQKCQDTIRNPCYWLCLIVCPLAQDF